MTKSYEISRLAVDFTDYREDVRDALAVPLSIPIVNNNH